MKYTFVLFLFVPAALLISFINKKKKAHLKWLTLCNYWMLDLLLRMGRLKGVPAIISPDLLHALASMGHGDRWGPCHNPAQPIFPILSSWYVQVLVLNIHKFKRHFEEMFYFEDLLSNRPVLHILMILEMFRTSMLKTLHLIFKILKIY